MSKYQQNTKIMEEFKFIDGIDIREEEYSSWLKVQLIGNNIFARKLNQDGSFGEKETFSSEEWQNMSRITFKTF